MAATNPDDVRMSLGEHLDELRKRIFLGLIGPVIAAGVLLIYATDIVSLLSGPLMLALREANQPTEMINRQVGGAFGIYLRVSFVGGLIIGIPWLGYQLWLFVAPALYPHERRMAVYMIPFSALLATIGVLFMYFVALPFTLWFLMQFVNEYRMPDLTSQTYVESLIYEGTGPPDPTPGLPPVLLPRLEFDPPDAPDGAMWIKVPENHVQIMLDGAIRRVRLDNLSLVVQQQDLSEYISFVMFFALAFAVSFQLPLIILGLAYTGVMDYRTMRRGWKVVMLGCAIVGAVLTPNDLASMAALAVPMYLLYEFGLLLVRLIEPRRKKPA